MTSKFVQFNFMKYSQDQKLILNRVLDGLISNDIRSLVFSYCNKSIQQYFCYIMNLLAPYCKYNLCGEDIIYLVVKCSEETLTIIIQSLFRDHIVKLSLDEALKRFDEDSFYVNVEVFLNKPRHSHLFTNELFSQFRSACENNTTFF